MLYINCWTGRGDQVAGVTGGTVAREVGWLNSPSLDGKGDKHGDLRDFDQGPRRVPGGSLNAMIHGLA